MGDLALLSDEELNRQFATEFAAPQASYCTDANLILPFLEKSDYNAYRIKAEGSDEPLQHHIIVHYDGILALGVAPTFPRAGVIALLTAKRTSPNI